MYAVFTAALLPKDLDFIGLSRIDPKSIRKLCQKLAHRFPTNSRIWLALSVSVAVTDGTQRASALYHNRGANALFQSLSDSLLTQFTACFKAVLPPPPAFDEAAAVPPLFDIVESYALSPSTQSVTCAEIAAAAFVAHCCNRRGTGLSQRQ